MKMGLKILTFESKKGKGKQQQQQEQGASKKEAVK